SALNGCIHAMYRLGRSDLAVKMINSLPSIPDTEDTQAPGSMHVAHFNWTQQFVETSAASDQLVRYLAYEAIPKIPNAARRYVCLGELSQLVLEHSVKT